MNILRSKKRNIALLLIVMAVASYSLVVAPIWRGISNRSATAQKLLNIQIALTLYYQENHCYPPQYLTDRQGRPAHSWRVLLLPFLHHKDLFRRYSFDEPWNGPHNRLLTTEMPEEFRSPFLDSKSTITQYLGIAGTETSWRGAIPLREEDLRPRDTTNSLIWVVEARNSDINWMEPRDMPFDQALAGINVAEGGGIQSNYPDALPAQTKPFGCEWIPINISPEKLRLMLTVAEQGKKGVGPATPDNR